MCSGPLECSAAKGLKQFGRAIGIFGPSCPTQVNVSKWNLPLERKGTVWLKVCTLQQHQKKPLKTSQCPVTGNRSKEVSRTSTQWNNLGPSYIIINEEHNIKQCNSKIILVLYKNYIWKKLCMWKKARGKRNICDRLGDCKRFFNVL